MAYAFYLCCLDGNGFNISGMLRWLEPFCQRVQPPYNMGLFQL